MTRLAFLFLLVGCGGSVEQPLQRDAAPDTRVVIEDPVDTGTAVVDDPPVVTDTGVVVPAEDAPRPADPPPFPAYSKGACPKLVAGPTIDTSINRAFATSDQKRDFRLIVPKSYDGSADWPLLIAYHWLNASSSSIIRDGELESAAEQMKFIVVVPDDLQKDDGKRAYQFTWPFAETWGQKAELTFFDDMLACVGEQYRIDKRRVHAVGVSAGGLWVTFLSTTDRAKHLASIESLSGGLGADPLGAWKMEYVPQPNKFPALVLWGGTSDWMILDFNTASTRYRGALLTDDHFVVSCTHDKGHAMPPIDPPKDGSTRLKPIWQFLLDHPYGTTRATSPYAKDGLPADFPAWCSIPDAKK
jgi:hypothetical protein